MIIGIIGATGTLGKPVTVQLVAAGFKVAALVRDVEKAKSLLPASVTLVQGDLQQTATLAPFLTQIDALYINLNLQQHQKPADYLTEREGLTTLLEHIKHYPIKRIAFISSLVKNYQGMNKFHWWVFDVKQQAVEKIRACGIPYTIFYPSNFMDNFNHVYRKGNKILLAGTSKEKMYFIAAADYGRQVARSFQILTTENKEYTIQGPDGYTADEAGAIYCKHYKVAKLTISKAPIQLLKILSVFSQSVHYGYHIISALNNYPEKFEAETTWRELGKPELSLESFASQQQ